MNINKRVISFSASVLVFIFVLYYYQYYPRYSIGYADVKVSKAVWDFALSGSRESYTGLYYERFQNSYNYKAYLLYKYYDLVTFIKSEYQAPLSHKKLVERIGNGNINDNDKLLVDELEPKYRLLFLESLSDYRPEDEEKKHIAQCLLQFYFTTYCSYKLNGFFMSKEEITGVINWIQKDNNDIDDYLLDPIGLRKVDFSIMKNGNILRNYISISIAGEWIRDVKLYDEMCIDFQTYLKETIINLK